MHPGKIGRRFAALAMTLTFCVAAPAADYQAVAVRAMALQQDFDYQAHAEDWLRLYRDDLSRKLAAGELERDEALAAAVADMRARAEAVEQPVHITVETDLAIAPYDEDEAAFPLGPLFPDGHHAFGAMHARQLPVHFLLLIANPAIAAHLEMAPEAAEAFWRERQSLPGQRRGRLGAVVTLELVAMPQSHVIHAVVRHVRLFTTPLKETPLREFTEDGDAEELVRSHRLAEGITWDRVENHGFSFLNLRFMEVLPLDGRDAGECRDLDRLGPHRHVACTLEHRVVRVPLAVTRHFVGGRLAWAEVRRAGDPDAQARRQLMHSLRRIAVPDVPARPEVDDTVTWNHRGVKLTLYPAAYEPETGRTLFLTAEAEPWLELKKELESSED